jgi:nuclear pore complex protein Nup160
MAEKLVVAAHVSALNPTIQLSSHIIGTSRKNTPLPSAFLSQQELPEHAIHSSLLHTPVTGTILLRLLHGGLILELSSLSAAVEPLRFIFPTPVQSFPNVFLSDNDQLHLLAVTSAASLYRIVIPIGPRRQLWHDQPQSHWYHEYLIENLPDRFQGLVHIHSIHSVAIAVENGNLLRIETDSIDDEGGTRYPLFHCYTAHSHLPLIRSMGRVIAEAKFAFLLAFFSIT